MMYAMTAKAAPAGHTMWLVWGMVRNLVHDSKYIGQQNAMEVPHTSWFLWMLMQQFVLWVSSLHSWLTWSQQEKNIPFWDIFFQIRYVHSNHCKCRSMHFPWILCSELWTVFPGLVSFPHLSFLRKVKCLCSKDLGYNSSSMLKHRWTDLRWVIWKCNDKVAYKNKIKWLL